jgi:uncharacterized protein (TIGR02271 family)
MERRLVMGNVYVGMTVRDSSGAVGRVVDIGAGNTGAARVTIQRADGSTQTLDQNSYTVYGDTLEIGPGAVTADLAIADAGVASAPTTRADVMDVEDGEDVTIPVVREEAVVGTREVDRGGVRIHKRVREREESVSQPTMREEVDVERVPIGRAIESAPEVREEGDTLIIPVVEEMLVVQKQLVLKEEIRITKRRFTEDEEVRVVLQEEDVEVERIGDEEGRRTAEA